SISRVVPGGPGSLSVGGWSSPPPDCGSDFADSLEHELIAQRRHRQIHALQACALLLHLALEDGLDVIEQRRKVLRLSEFLEILAEGARRVVAAVRRELLLAVREAHF